MPVPASTRTAELAVTGGDPVRTTPFAPWPFFADDEIAAVVEVLRSGRVNYWTGDEGRVFEREYAAAVGAEHAVAVANGTVALELALRAAGVQPGDEVVVPARTFVATASAAVAIGAHPVVADIDAETQSLTAETVRAVLTPRTRAIVPVHLAGWPAPMDELMALADEHSLVVVEDCAQAHGAALGGRPIGTFGHVAAWSFCQDKILTTAGEGGMVTTDDEAIWRAVWEHKDHGKSYQAVYEREHPPGFRWLHESFGTNARMSEVQAALGRRALAKLPAWSERRRRFAAALDAGLAGVPGLRLTVPPDGVRHAYYKYYLFVRPEELAPGWTRDRIMTAVEAEGVPCFQGACAEIYREKAFDAEGRPPAPLPVARELGETSLMLLVHPTLDDRDIDDTVEALRKVMAAATGATSRS
ncbi:DegT/DnrJ/EryC1/StrS family aminotransferase [Actinopolymorpha alba]|uniref:DegT/DnrJ/EryC1/StrS family aminotransferase n=1 Tax=Actinopolymorpha alba TaxID=533267 RepID=UPI0003752C8B|nr:DegT/DnrJ/EryC1/StrS aminotransferase family protein [Actinopolymorpha alba]